MYCERKKSVFSQQFLQALTNYLNCSKSAPKAVAQSLVQCNLKRIDGKGELLFLLSITRVFCFN